MNGPERWMSFAREDLRAAEILLREDVFSQACFHAQQAVEKALKAALLHRDPARSLPRTHSISELTDAQETVAIAREVLATVARFLAPWSVESRPDPVPQ